MTETSESTSDNLTSLGSTAYSFYLNVVVLNHLAGASNPETSGSGATTEEPAAEQEPEDEPKNNVESSEAEEAEGVSDLPSTPTDHKSGPNFQHLINTSVHNTMKALTKSSKAVSQRLATDKSLQNTMKAITQSSLEVSKKATTFVASKTMVARASHALTKSLPELVEQTGLKGMQLSRKFHEGSVLVVQVDLKPTELPDYIKEVSGEEAANSYRTALSCLKSLGMSDSVAALEREMLPQVRRGLMDKFSDMLISNMKANENMLEVQCIPLEETEEARWLFTFMEFRAQMK